MKPYIFLFYFLLLQVLSAEAGYYQKTFGTPGADAGRSVKQLNDGSIYVLGYSDSANVGKNEMALSKLKADGNLMWTKLYKDSLSTVALHLTLDYDQNLIACGQVTLDIDNEDAFVCKLDTAGEIIWFKKYGGTKYQSFKYIEACADRGFIACGYTSDLSSSNDFYCVKLDSMGNVEWWGNYGGSSNDYAMMIHQTADGGFIVSGDTNSDGAGSYDVEVIRLSSTGSVIWDRLFGDSLSNGCQGLLALQDGSFASYGETESSVTGAFDFFIQKMDANGTELYRNTFGGIKADAIFSLLEAANGDFVFTGYSNSYSSGPLNLVIGKTDSLANLRWIRNYGDSGVDIGYEIIAEKDSGYLIFGTAATDFFLLYVSDSGAVVGITEPTAESFLATGFPNPSNGKLAISIPDAWNEKGLLQVISSSGVCVWEELIQPTFTKTIEVNFSDQVKPGIYQVRIMSKNKSYTSRICVTE